MDFPTTSGPATPGHFWRGRALAAAVAALGLYAAILVLRVGTYAGGADSSGYFNHARLLTEGRLHVAPRIVPGLSSADFPPYLFIPLGFKPAPDGNGMVPTYPPGLPLLFAAAARLVGWGEAGNLVLVLHSLAGVLLTYALGRQAGLGRRGSIFATAILALSPLYLFMSLTGMSDVPATAWTLAAVLAAWRSRERRPWALAAGAALAGAVLIRPNDLLALLPIGLALGWAPRRWLGLVLGGLPGAAFFLLHSRAAYGSFLTTGYGNAGLEFSARFLPIVLRHYGHWIPILFTPIAPLCLGLPWIGRSAARSAAILLAWILAYAGFYAAYRWTFHAWWFLRFLLPAAPALAVGGVLVVRRIALLASPTAAALRSNFLLAAALGAVALNSALWDFRLYALNSGRDERKYEQIAGWLDRHAPPGAIILCMQVTGSLYYYTDATFVRWDMLDPASAAKVETAVARAGRAFYAVLYPYEDPVALQSWPPGRWQQVGAVDDVKIYRLRPVPPHRSGTGTAG